MARFDRFGAESPRPRPRTFPSRPAHRSRASLRRLASVQGKHRLRQHDSCLARKAVSGRPRARAAHRVADPLECGRDGRAREPRQQRVRRTYRDLCLVRDALRSRLQPFLARAFRPSPRRHDLRAGAFEPRPLRACLSRRTTHRGTAQALPPGSRRQGTFVVSASLADAGLLAVSDGVDGPWPIAGHHAGALRALSRAPRACRALGPEDLVLPGRRRDGRARIDGRADDAGAREARQPRVRHQLQPAAPRRPRARQRQDHPGARGRLPRRGLERDQGDLGLPWDPLLARDASGLLRQRMEEAVDGEYQNFKAKGGAYTARISSASTRSSWSWSKHVGRRDRAAQPGRPRRGESLERLCGGGCSQGPADRDPRENGQRLRDGQGGRGAEYFAPAEEARRRGVEGVPRPLPHSGHGRRNSARAVLPARRGQRGDAVPEGHRKTLGGSLPCAARTRRRSSCRRSKPSRTCSMAARGAKSRPRWRSCAS